MRHQIGGPSAELVGAKAPGEVACDEAQEVGTLDDQPEPVVLAHELPLAILVGLEDDGHDKRVISNQTLANAREEQHNRLIEPEAADDVRDGNLVAPAMAVVVIIATVIIAATLRLQVLDGVFQMAAVGDYVDVVVVVVVFVAAAVLLLARELLLLAKASIGGAVLERVVDLLSAIGLARRTRRAVAVVVRVRVVAAHVDGVPQLDSRGDG